MRFRAVELADFTVAAEIRSSDDGVASLAQKYAVDARPSHYRSIVAAALRQLTARLPEALKGAPIMISGMASSSIGWQDVPYARLPLALDGSQLAWCELEPVESDAGPHRVVLISGACTDTDVMRGEETELVGLFTLPAAGRLAAGSLVIKPGTHSKHLRVENGRLVGLQTFMSGELFDVLGKHSILKHSIGDPAAAGPLSAEMLADLRTGVRHARSIPMSAALFRVRTRQLLDNLGGARNRAFLSGVLLGSELAYLLDDRFGGLQLVLCATVPLEAHYRAALDELGLTERLTVISAHEVELLSSRAQAVLWRHLGGN